MDQATQPSTQPFYDPRRLGKMNSDVSEDDVADIICLLYPNSEAAFEAVRATMLVGPQHIHQNDDLQADIEEGFDLRPELTRQRGTRDIALRISSNVKNPKAGFVFGRNRHRCDVLLVKDENEKMVSNMHFKIFVNSQGSLMLQDTSMNGTFVDDELLISKDKDGRPMSKPATQALKNGSLICVVGPRKTEIRLLVRVPSRGDHEDRYEERLKKYLAARGKVAQFASMRENAFGNHWNGGMKYNFVGMLGKGAFASVFRVQTKKEGTVFAAKEIDKRRFIKNGVLDVRFDSEIQIMKGLRHPHIVEYVDCHEHEQWIYIIMEYVPCGELSAELARRGGFLPESWVQAMTRQILHALSYLHRHNITHRDIKPDNILIASYEPPVVKLSDFGLSKCVQNQETYLKTFCGTLLYCAPEVYPNYVNYERGVAAPKRRRLGEPPLRTSPYDQSVDMWSFGAVLFHVLCGRAPILGKGDNGGDQMLNNIMTKDIDFEPLRTLGISSNAIDFIGSLLNRNPRLRPKENECLRHPWVADVEDPYDCNEEDEAPLATQFGLEVVEEAEENFIDDEADDAFEAILELANMTGNARYVADAPRVNDERPLKRIKRSVLAPSDRLHGLPLEVMYPILPPVQESPTIPGPSSAPARRLFGEISASVLRSSGVFGETAPAAADVPEIRNRVEQISVNDFVTFDGTPSDGGGEGSEHPLQYPQTLSIPQVAPGPAPSLLGAEAQIGQLNMASPEGESSGAATPDTTNPITPRTREESPAGPVIKLGNTDGPHESPPEPNFERRIDLALIANGAAFAASVEAREASRARKLREKETQLSAHSINTAQLDYNELARTIDEHTGREVSSAGTETPPTGNPGDHTTEVQVSRRIDVSQFRVPEIPSTIRLEKFIKPTKRLGRLKSLPGSFTNLTINLDKRMTSWGRGMGCTVQYADKKDTRIPKYALQVTFWAPGVEELPEQEGDWKEIPGIRTVVSTSTTRCIWVNDVELRKQTASGDAALFGKIYTGDIITIFKSSDPQGPTLKFKIEINFGDSARERPENEKGFQIQKETHHHRRMMKERESTRLSDKENNQPKLAQREVA